jgi:arginase family enzyme
VRELKRLEDRCEIILLHFNVDVIDSGTFPLANYPIPGGLSFEQAMAALEDFLMREQLYAVFVTGANPLNDPDGKMVEKLVDGIVEAIRTPEEHYRRKEGMSFGVENTRNSMVGGLLQ